MQCRSRLLLKKHLHFYFYLYFYYLYFYLYILANPNDLYIYLINDSQLIFIVTDENIFHKNEKNINSLTRQMASYVKTMVFYYTERLKVHVSLSSY